MHQPHISFLDQIQKLHAAPDIVLGKRNNQTQISLCKSLARRFVSRGNPFPQLSFLRFLKERDLTDLTQVDL